MCWDDVDLINGRPTGALRASLGHVSTFQEVYALLRLLNRYFVSNTPSTLAADQTINHSRTHTNSIPATYTTPDSHTQHQVAHNAESDALKLEVSKRQCCESTFSISSPNSNLSRSASTSSSSSSSNVNTSSAMSAGHSCDIVPHSELSSAELDEGFVSCEEDLEPDVGQIDPALIGDHAHAFQIHHQIRCLGQGHSRLGLEDVNGQLAHRVALQASPLEVSKQGCSSTGMGGVLTHIYLYPIKSCAPQQVIACRPHVC